MMKPNKFSINAAIDQVVADACRRNISLRQAFDESFVPYSMLTNTRVKAMIKKRVAIIDHLLADISEVKP